jgi:hypothetical protein
MRSLPKFSFDDCFDTPPPRMPEPVTVDPCRVREDLARTEGFEAGRVAAREEATSRSAEAIAVMARRLEQALAEADRLRAMTTEDAAELAIATANLIASPAAPVAMGRHVAARLADIIAEFTAVPVLEVRVSEAMQPHVLAAIDHVVAKAELCGRVDVVADPGMAIDDLAIDWRNGGLVERRADRVRLLAERLGEYLATADEGN